MTAIPKFNWKAEKAIQEGYTTKSNFENVKQGLNHLRNLPKVSDEQIVLFLVACDNDVTFTLHTIKMYFKTRHAAPEFFKDRNCDEDSLKQAIEVVETSIIPKRTKDNYAIISSRLRDTNYWNFNVDPATKALLMCLDAILYEKPAKGFIILFDMKGVGLMHLTRIKVSSIRKFLNYLQEGLPCKLKEIHIFNCTYLFDKILLIIKPFMKRELMDLLHPHQGNCDMEEVYEKYVPRDCLPLDYGGRLGSLGELSRETSEKLDALRGFFEDDESQLSLYKKEK